MHISLLPDPILKKKIHPLNFLIFGLFLTIIVGTLLLLLPAVHRENVDVSLPDAFFTATSATTVTGLSTVTVSSTFNFWGQLIILVLINLGGLGYMTIVTFFLLNHGIRGLKYALFVKESLNLPSLEDIFSLGKKVFLTIAAFEIVGVILLTFFWQEKGFLRALWLGIFHSMSAFNNAGFDLLGSAGTTPYATAPLFNITIMALIFLGGIGVIVISDLLAIANDMKKKMSLHTKIVLVTSGSLIVLGAVGFFALEQNGLLEKYDSPFDTSLISLFHSVSARTAGFSTVDLGNASTATLLFFSSLMFVGASPGSSGGGIKTTTFSLLVLFVFYSLRNKPQPEAFGRKISRESVEKALQLFLLSIAVIFFFILFLSILEDYPLQKIIFETFSAFGTVGLTTGIIPTFSSASKCALAVLMFIGRLTPLTLLFWISIHHRSKVDLLEEHVSVG
ncbi:Trk family potassium uptake protein [Candidatus Woesearchaeota archaeon]|nr:Trk family potassium uptake protein [Candidatus Woesearchaeota archaeon]